MRISDLGRYALGVCATAMLASCGGGSGTPLSPSPAGVTAERTHVRPAYRVLYSFAGGSRDGDYPEAELINVNGTLYGTTEGGGTDCSASGGCGTVFTVTSAGKEHVLHAFKGTDGEKPCAGLTNVDGTLYGTTLGGGANDYGTVFSITAAGKERTLYSFKGGSDGEYSSARLTSVNGELYGAAGFGGSGSGSECYSEGCGTVFEVSVSGVEHVLYNFIGGSDGANPSAGLINVDGTLYGTTFAGGFGSGGSNIGTVFSITTAGNERALYNFKGMFGDGANPNAGLTYLDGTLYGTTTVGGDGGHGTVFSITTAGQERVLHDFKGKRDGSNPFDHLTKLNGALYGVTYNGGSYSAGTVFSIATSGAESVLYSFKGAADGAEPWAGLTDVKGTLYGTTERGGGAGCSDHQGCGTVFSLSP